jgi:multidrug resistance efflux pump
MLDNLTSRDRFIFSVLVVVILVAIVAGFWWLMS